MKLTKYRSALHRSIWMYLSTLRAEQGFGRSLVGSARGLATEAPSEDWLCPFPSVHSIALTRKGRKPFEED